MTKRCESCKQANKGRFYLGDDGPYCEGCAYAISKRRLLAIHDAFVFKHGDKYLTHEEQKRLNRKTEEEEW